MTAFELNKLAGAVLFAGIAAMVSWIVSDLVYEGPYGRKEGVVAYNVPGAEEGGKEAAASGEEAAEAEKPAVPLPTLLAAADPANGKKIFRKCLACHTAEAGGKLKGPGGGPNLWNVVGRPVASLNGFDYSDAMKAHGGNWTFEALFAFLADPKGVVKGTKMNFGGLQKPSDRADVLAYLRELSDSPVALPSE